MKTTIIAISLLILTLVLPAAPIPANLTLLAVVGQTNVPPPPMPGNTPFRIQARVTKFIRIPKQAELVPQGWNPAAIVTPGANALFGAHINSNGMFVVYLQQGSNTSAQVRRKVTIDGQETEVAFFTCWPAYQTWEIQMPLSLAMTLFLEGENFACTPTSPGDALLALKPPFIINENDPLWRNKVKVRRIH